MNRMSRGDFLPNFIADSSINPTFNFSSLAGHRFLLVFVADAQAELATAMSTALLDLADWFKGHRLLVYVVTTARRDADNDLLKRLSERFTIFWDADRNIHRLYGMQLPPPESDPGAVVVRVGAMVIRENLRLHAAVGGQPIDGIPERLQAAVASLQLRPPAQEMQQHAPVLQIPEVVTPAYCRQLIDYYESQGGGESGFMRDVQGLTHGLLDPKMKRRKDCIIEDQRLLSQLQRALATRVLPEVRKAFGFNATRIERYLIGCYDEADRGFFGAHRDNTSKGTAHRKFAMSLNLNSEEYEGGALRFPEYGQHTYKPATGCAVIFSCSLLHEATPVTKGRRYVVLPFLYDEAGAVLRSQNRQFLKEDPPVLRPVESAPVDSQTAA